MLQPPSGRAVYSQVKICDAVDNRRMQRSVSAAYRVFHAWTKCQQTIYLASRLAILNAVRK